MKKLESLLLVQNEITTIEAKAFDDLVNLRAMSLWHNKIATLEQKLFIKMVNLEAIDLSRVGKCINTFKITYQNVSYFYVLVPKDTY